MNKKYGFKSFSDINIAAGFYPVVSKIVSVIFYMYTIKNLKLSWFPMKRKTSYKVLIGKGMTHTQKNVFQIIFLFVWNREKQDIHHLNVYDQMKLSVKMEKLLKETYIELQS